MKQLKTGDVIVITDPRGVEMIAIFNRFGDNNTLYIYIQVNCTHLKEWCFLIQ